MFYFDHNSTTPLDPRVAEVLNRAGLEFFGNPSSIHRAGQNARRVLEKARRNIAARLGALASEIVFTSGGTESNNLAIRGILNSESHAITSTIEHPSVLETFRDFERNGGHVTYISVNSNGLIDLAALSAAIGSATRLISVMAANNETGVIQPISEIPRIIGDRSIFFHVDGVQAAGKIPLNIKNSKIDLLSFSGHKIYAPKGIGVLYVRKGVPLKNRQTGGPQEHGLRSGTENVAAAAALEAALELCTSDDPQNSENLRAYFEQQLACHLPQARVNAQNAPRLPNTSNVFFPGIPAENMLIALDLQDCCVSTGSACSSGSIEPSHVLLAMGLSIKEAKSCLRFSFGRENTRDQVDHLLAAIVSAVASKRERQLA